jgi:hypothetical protein
MRALVLAAAVALASNVPPPPELPAQQLRLMDSYSAHVSLQSAFQAKTSTLAAINPDAKHYNCSVYFNGNILVLGNHCARSSNGGSNWSTITSLMSLIGTGAVTEVARSPNRVVAMATTGAILTSTDGINWVQVGSEITHPKYDILWLDGMWYIPSNSGRAIISYDGINWSVKTTLADAYPGTTTWPSLWGYNGRELLGVVSPGYVYRSYDRGETWETWSTPISGAVIYCITYDTNRDWWWIGCGENRLLFSFNRGESWVQVNNIQTDAGTVGRIWSMVADGNRVYAVVGSYRRLYVINGNLPTNIGSSFTNEANAAGAPTHIARHPVTRALMVTQQLGGFVMSTS